jgi:tetraacyldisaccharide 4'-kinase
MRYLRLLLFPVSLIYALVVIVRNWCYDTGIFKSRKFYVPVVSVGNLDVGGAGKTPMTEYLVRLLKPHYKLATLSRGYGRTTKGIIVEGATVINVKSHEIISTSPTKGSKMSLASRIGDEPAQFRQKFQDITVAVSENRITGIKSLKYDHNLIIMDDAFQHRAVTPGLSILLFDYSRLSEPHWMLPSGNLREPFSGRKRADVIVISKCPHNISVEEQLSITNNIRSNKKQPIYFTSISYLPLQTIERQPANAVISADTTVFLLTGIANPLPMLQHIEKYTQHIIHHNYPDHHRFSLKNISKLADEFEACTSKNKLVITTEKDAQRLVERELLPLVQQMAIFVLPIGVEFLNGTQQQFDQFVINYVRQYTEHHPVH